MAKRDPSPVAIKRAVETGLKTDSDFWGSMVLMVGSGASRALSSLEHIEFLASAKEGGFKMILQVWNGLGWWVVVVIAAVWLYSRIAKRNVPHEVGPTWGLLVSCSFVAALFASIATVQFSGVIPKILVSSTFSAAIGGNRMDSGNCGAQIDGQQLASFKKDYKVALICLALDANTDQFSDPHILVSPLFEIVSGVIPMTAGKSPNGDFTIQHAQPMTLNYYPVLVPRDLPWEKISSLADLQRQGGKILDPRYY